MPAHQVIPFRMSPDEKEMLKEICTVEDLSMAQWIRRQINKAHKAMKVRQKKSPD